MKFSQYKIKFLIGVFVSGLLFGACSSKTTPEKNAASKNDYKPVTLKESFFTERDENDNVDSPTIWNHADTVNWIVSTAKETDVLLVHDAATGKFIKRACQSGAEPGQLKRPNGIAVIADMAIVVERDNHRVQLFSLPEFNSLGILGAEDLIKPYGLTVFKNPTGVYELYVSDNYETENEEIPADSLLNKRIHHYQFSLKSNTLEWKLVKEFGATSGEGVLKTVESLIADTTYKTLMISDENHAEKNIKIYNLAGEFTGKILGDGIFKYEPEGIALYQASDSTGYWICTDQSHEANVFHVFDRKTLEHLGGFIGEGTRNTDGVALSQYSFGEFSEGAFYPVHDDGNVSAISWKTISDSLKLSLKKVLNYK